MIKSTVKRDWKVYYDTVANRPLTAFDRPGMAIDLGCGDGRDTTPKLVSVSD